MRQNVYSSSYKPYIKETMFKNCLLLYKSKIKKRKLIKLIKERRGKEEGGRRFFCFCFCLLVFFVCFFLFVFSGCSKHQSQGIQPHSIYSIKLIQTVTYRISTDQIAIKDGCCCGGIDSIGIYLGIQ